MKETHGLQARNDRDHDHGLPGGHCVSRRRLLLTGGAAVTLIALNGIQDRGDAAPLHALKADYPRQGIGKVSALRPGSPIEFAYPYATVSNILVKLDVPAGGGVGPAQDIVAFNQVCTHMGGPLHGSYKKEHQILGPCQLHLTTFDLTRHGMVVSGHATESLPQIVLETVGDDIYAVGVMGLVYGYAANVAARRA
ncbi:arsenate reductase (azurin) small subunit [Bradyrhizobium sp.]|uniref:arsenate reductase (azurin) small subunit n=1 Tax=Bradyrhizobium sp. TaxID=376 RepID=UPI004037A420